MKKNIIIGVLSVLLILMTLSRFVKNTQAEEAEKEAIRCQQVAEEQRERAEMARENIEMLSAELLRRVEKARELAQSKE